MTAGSEQAVRGRSSASPPSVSRQPLLRKETDDALESRQGAILFACEAAGIGVIPAALNVVGVLATIVTIIGVDDKQTEAKNALKDWAIDKIADRIVTVAVSAVV